MLALLIQTEITNKMTLFLYNIKFNTVKNFKYLTLICALLYMIPQIGNSQCTGDSWDFNEDEFMPGSVMATEAMNGGPITTNQIDLNADGTLDIEVTYEAMVFSPNANGICDDGDFAVGAGFGGTGALTTTSDFAATTSDDCVCTNGIIIMTVDMINGFNTDVANFEFNATSQNGSSEAYEYGFGFVSAATDAAGAPIMGLNTSAAVQALVPSFCNNIYAAGTTMSMHTLSSTTGVFTTQADDLNAGINDCAVSGQNGEDTVSGSGPNSTLSTGASGLAMTDLITQVTYIYGLSNSVGTDCDGDGDTGVGSNPSGSFAGIEGCFTAPTVACGYTFEVSTNESCGEFTIDITNIVGMGDADPVTTEPYDVIINGIIELTSVIGMSQLAIAGMPPFVADGSTPYSVVLQLSSDALCESDPVNFTAPAGTRPNMPVFIPNNPTTGN